LEEHHFDSFEEIFAVEAPLTAIELTGTVDEQQQLQLDDVLPLSGPQRVRVIVLYSPADTREELEWLKSAARSPAFSDLADPAEDVYSLADGKPFHDAT
jgi:hypothetical protein